MCNLVRHEKWSTMFEDQTYLTRILHAVPQPLLVMDAEINVVAANDALYHFFQLSRAMAEKGLASGLCNIPEVRELAQDVLQRGSQIDNIEVEREFPIVGRKTLSLSARPIAGAEYNAESLILLAIDDITERRQGERQIQRLEDELSQAQVLEGVSPLVAVLAHDLNNQLNIVQGYGYLLKELGLKDELIAESALAILAATKRGAGVVNRLFSLTRRGLCKLEPVNLDGVIADLAQTLRRRLGPAIEIAVEPGDNLPAVLADRNQLARALSSLCARARGALSDEGKLAISTAAVQRNSEENSREWPEELYIRIEVAAAHDGQPAPSSFEAYSPTVPADREADLGLAMVYGILRGHNGFFEVAGTPHGKCSFRVYLPGIASPSS